MTSQIRPLLRRAARVGSASGHLSRDPCSLMLSLYDDIEALCLMRYAGDRHVRICMAEG